MRFTVYLPDDLGQRARAAKVPFSAIFRAAIEQELEAHEAEATELKPGTYRAGRVEVRVHPG